MSDFDVHGRRAHWMIRGSNLDTPAPNSTLQWQALLVAWLVLGSMSCESEIRGQLVVSLETDMALPDQIDQLRLQVLVHGRTHHEQDYQLGGSANSVRLPATLTLLAGEDPALSVIVRVAGSKGGQFRTFREVTTTVPYGRLTHVRMPLQWLCDQTAEKVSSDPLSTAVRSTCDAGKSCVAGECVFSVVDSHGLPEFAARNVYGGGETPKDGKCFDTLPCMITGNAVEPDTDCSIELPQWNNLNVALRVPRSGICDDSGSVCFVPLDGNSLEGWLIDSEKRRIRLRKPVCDKLALGLISGVYVSTQCPTKTAADPPCGEWSSVTTKGEQPADSALARAPQVGLIAKLDPDTDGTVCCPLLSDDKGLYSCTCTSETQARVLHIDPSDGSKTLAFSVSPPAAREHERFAAALAKGDFFWAFDGMIERVDRDGSVSKILLQDADTYDDSPLLSDESGLTVLANRAKGGDAPVQVLHVTYDGSVKPLDTGGNHPVPQFAQSSDAVYVATDVDVQKTPTGSIDRTSTVVRIDKRTGARTQLVPDEHLATPRIEHGGYLGVQMGSNMLYALFETAAVQTGMTGMQVRGIDPSSRSAASPTVLYEVPIDPSHTRLIMLGLADNTPILARIEYATITNETGTVRSASIFAMPGAGEPPRILADLANDTPLQGIVGDERRIYVLSRGGALLGIARTGLP